MTDKSAAALEREAETVRGQVAETAETLREKMNPSYLMEEVTDYFRSSDASTALENLKMQIRDNPLPLALVGIGLAWLFLGGGPSTDRIRRSARGYAERWSHDDYDEDMDDGYYTDEDWDEGMSVLGGTDPGYAPGRAGGGGSRSRSSGRLGSMASGVSGAASNVASTVSDAASSAYSAAEGAASTVTGAASGAAHAAASAGRKAMRGARMMAKTSTRAGRTVRHGYRDILDREPLVLGALGLAVGAAVGAMMPRTRYEDEVVGPYRDSLRDEAGRMVSEGIQEAKDVAAHAYREVKNEADKQGLTSGEGDSIAEKVSNVAKSAASKAESAAREKLAASGSASTASGTSGSGTSASGTSKGQTGSSPSTGPRSI